MYEAQCILKQRLRKSGKRQFLVKWTDQTSANSWCNEIDVYDALLENWFSTHNQKGLKRNRLNVALINVPSTWDAYAGGGGKQKPQKGLKEWINSGTNYKSEQIIREGGN